MTLSNEYKAAQAKAIVESIDLSRFDGSDAAAIADEIVAAAEEATEASSVIATSAAASEIGIAADATGTAASGSYHHGTANL